MSADAGRAVGPHRGVKRAMGHLRSAARILAPLLDDFDLVAELRLDDVAGVDEARTLLVREVERRGALDLVVLARPRTRPDAPAAQDASRRTSSVGDRRDA